MAEEHPNASLAAGPAFSFSLARGQDLVLRGKQVQPRRPDS